MSTSSGPAAPDPQRCSSPVACFSRPAGQRIALAVQLPTIQPNTWVQ